MAGIQAIDATTLRALVAEQRASLLPTRFEKAQQPDPQTLQLALRGLDRVRWLELSWLAEAPRLLLIPPPPRQGEGSTLARQMQHGLRGLALVQLAQQGWERVVELDFARRPGDPPERRLVLELMGRHSNLFLLDGQGRVTAAGRQVRSGQSRLRPIGTGDAYSPPPALMGDPPTTALPLETWRRRLLLLPLPLGRALQSSFQGISPSLLRQLCHGLEGPAGADLLETPVGDLEPQHWQALHQRWQAWLAAVEGGRFQAFEGGGSDYRCWWPPDCGDPTPRQGPQAGQEARAEQGAQAPINRALAAYYGERLAARRFGQRRASLQQRLDQALQRERGEAERQQTLLAATADHAALQAEADALLCRPDPPREVVAMAQKLYQRARKLRRAVEAISGRLDLHRQQLAWLEASLAFLEGCEDSEALGELEEELEAQLSPRSSERRRRAPTGGSPRPLELRSPGGLRLQVGRNHRQNDWISLRQARRGDLWFHAQECPGSHVVLKASEALAGAADRQAAADLAAHFSRARGNRRVPVLMVAAETLQRMPGAGPGTVRHGAGAILWGEPDRAPALLAVAGDHEARRGDDRAAQATPQATPEATPEATAHAAAQSDPDQLRSNPPPAQAQSDRKE